MAKVIIAREEDKGKTATVIMVMLVTCFVGGFGGIPVGAILSAVMQAVLKDNSAPVMYGFFGAPIVLGMLIALFYVRKDMDTKNHTVCTECRHKMKPLTEMDTIFSIPAEFDQKYENPFQYLAQNMTRVYSVHEIPQNKRGCYVCCYGCTNCTKRIVRIYDFLPQRGTCHWKEVYYYDFSQFIQARGKNDLL